MEKKIFTQMMKNMKTNMQPILLMLKGLPASGKTTYARKLLSGEEKFEGANGEKMKWKNITKDDLRAMIHAGKHSSDLEKDIILARDILIRTYLSAGYSVISSDTNLAPKHEVRLKQIAEQQGAKFFSKFFDVGVDECIKRDIRREHPVGAEVIENMHAQFIRPTLTVKQDPNLPHAFIFDLDGTLALLNGRNPYDASTCENDLLNTPVAELLDTLCRVEGNDIILMSGRNEDTRPQTEAWLKKYNVPYTALFMRPSDNWIHDGLMKRQLFMDNVYGKWYIKGVFDDRERVIRAWRDLGLQCYQVADGKF